MHTEEKGRKDGSNVGHDHVDPDQTRETVAILVCAVQESYLVGRLGHA
jgi:hypothetical protein